MGSVEFRSSFGYTIYSIGGLIVNEKGLIVIYNTPENGVKVEAKLVDDNVWMTQEQIVKLYQSSKSNISEHIKHILDEGELEEGATVRKFRIVQFEGGSEEDSVVRNFRTTAAHWEGRER